MALSNAASISRQTIHRALARDEISPRTAKRIDDALGSGSGAATTQHSAARRVSRASRAWVQATDLEDWSNRREAQEDLPLVVRRLILVTVDGVRRLSFRAGEGVQLGGWDGRLSTSSGSAFVPEGESVWELSTTPTVAAKAQEDYEKRTKRTGDVDPTRTTFVFVTSRRWASKDTWTADRRAEGRWRDVRVLDADDLETWLETAPSVHVWLSGRIGVFPESGGAQDLDTWFENWSNATEPRLTPTFLLAGRDEGSQAIERWRSAPGEPLAIRSESRDESIAVLASVFTLLPADAAADAMARAVVVANAAAWRRLMAARVPLILIPTFDVGDETMAAVRAGHAVVIPVGESDSAWDNSIVLPPIGREKASDVLKAAGLNDERARELSGIARRSMTAFRRRIGRAASLHVPAWASPAVARSILPALFAGGWNEKTGDTVVVGQLAAKSYERFADDLTQWAHGTDPVVRNRAGIWYLVSREDAWNLLGRYVRSDDVERFYQAALEVLSTPDPRFELPSEQRWMAGVLGKKAAHSGPLRRGIAATLGLLGSRFDSESDGGVTDPAIDPNLRTVAARVVRELLRRANDDWTIWASLSDLLGELAEAAPDEFLGELEAGLRNPGAPISRLFTDQTDEGGGLGAMFASSPHTGLLWALERLAWSPRYLGRVAELLAALAKRDPGGRLTNRPSASLKAIFRPWMPQTVASLDQRFRVLDALTKRDQQRAWEILRSTLPEFHGVGFYSARPAWRESWGVDRDKRVTHGEYETAVSGAVERLLRLAGTNGARWAALVEALPQLGSADHAAIVTGLSRLELKSLDPDSRHAIWDAIRRTVADHRAFPNADWRMPDERIADIDRLRERFSPSDAGTRYGWLFSWRADLPDAKTIRTSDHRAYEREVNEARVTAVRAVFAESGLAGLMGIAKVAERAQFVGNAAAEAAVLTESEDQLLIDHLGGEAHRDEFARGYAMARQRADTGWVTAMLARIRARLRPDQLAALLAVLPSDRASWALVEAMGEETERIYWEWQMYLNVESDLEVAVEKLLRFGQVAKAVDFMGLYGAKVRVRSALILEGLEQLLSDGSQARRLSSSFGHYLGELLDALAEDVAVDRARIARLEWRFLPLLEGRERSPKILHAALAEDPSLFVQLIEAVFRREGDPRIDESEIKPEDRDRASRAYALLRSWRTVPGTRERGGVDEEKLREWVGEARRQLADARRSVIGDQEIGQMLSGAPADPDGTWPCAAVRSVIEEVRSDELENGLSIGLYNSRGVVSRSIGEGGVLERALAERYEGLAIAVADSAPRTGRMLRLIADSYRLEAQREDLSAALEDDLGQ